MLLLLWSHRHRVRHVITLRAVAAEVVADEPEFVGHAGGERAGPGAPGESVAVVEVPTSSAVPPAGLGNGSGID